MCRYLLKILMSKTSMRYHLTLVRMAAIKKYTKKKKNSGEDVEKKESSYTVGGNAD